MGHIDVNLQFQIIALFFVLMVFTLFCMRRKLRITRERVFLGMIVATLDSVLLDMLSVAAIGMHGRISPQVTDLIRRVYLISVVGVGLCIFMYTLAEIYKMAIFEPALHKLYLLPFILSVPIILKAPLSENPEASFGAAVYICNFMTITYLLISLGYAVFARDRLTLQRQAAIFIAATLLSICGVAQLCTFHIRIVSLGFAAVLTYMYMVLESPDVYVDKNFDAFNRDAFIMYLDNRCMEKKPISVMYISLNEFSNMSEIAGTTITSRLMRMAADHLKSYRSGRLFCMDSDDFMLTFENDRHFFEYAQDIRDRFHGVWTLDDADPGSLVEFEIRISIVAYGAMRMPHNVTAKDITDIIKYFAQKAVRNRLDYICIDRRQLWEMEAVSHVNREIDGAVEEGRVDVFYQPIFSVYENKCSEIEALIRVRDRRNIYFDNSLIIPAAETSGEITKLGYEVFRKICAFVSESDLKKAGISRIAVNLSMVQCQQRHLADDLIEIMEQYGVSAALFRFEIAETTAEYMTQNLRRNMNRLIAQGAAFVIDDYGNRRIDPDKVTQISKDYIKLGEAVVRRYFDGEKTKQSMRVLCRMLLQLRMTVAAVGVENQKQYAELKNLGISHMQGNAFYRPMTGEAVLEVLEKEKNVMLGNEVQYERAL